MNTFRPFDRDQDDPVRAAAQKVIDKAKAEEAAKRSVEAPQKEPDKK